MTLITCLPQFDFIMMTEDLHAMNQIYQVMKSKFWTWKRILESESCLESIGACATTDLSPQYRYSWASDQLLDFFPHILPALLLLDPVPQELTQAVCFNRDILLRAKACHASKDEPHLCHESDGGLCDVDDDTHTLPYQFLLLAP